MDSPKFEPPLAPDRWVDEHGDVLFRFAKARVGRTDVAEDLVQETLLAGLRGQKQFRGESGERTWLLAILKRKIVDLRRRESRDPSTISFSTSDEWIDDLFDKRGRWKTPPGKWTGSPESSLELAEFWTAFSNCLGKLPLRMANAFSGREIDQIPSEEICKDLGISSTNLWVLLHRARLRLWKCLDSNWFAGEQNS